MKTSFYCCKSAIILTFFFSFAVANASDINVLEVSLDKYFYHPGDTADIYYKFRVNNPSGEIKTISVEVYASSDTSITEDDFYLGGESESAGVGIYTQGSLRSYQIPGDIPQGDYYIGVIISSDTGLSDTGYDSSTVFICPAGTPDLKLTYIGIWDSYSIIPGGSGSVNFTVENIGTDESGEFFVYLYVSEDTTITDDDYEVGHHRVGSLDPREETNIYKAFSLPDDIPCGDYYIGGIVDCSNETNLENNSCCGDSFSVVAPVDISVQNVSVNLKNCIPGGSINVTVTVENIEQMSSDAYTVDYYASTNYTTTHFLGSLERSGLSSGETETFDHLCQLPQDIPQGQYYIGVKLTCDNDTNDDNNEGWSTFITVGPSSNLAVESLEGADGTYIPGDQITVYTLIKNIGDVASQAYTVDYYASTDANITTSDYYIGYVNRSGLAAGAQHSYDTTCQFPPNMPAGNYHIGIIITCPQEYDPANNVGCDSATVELVHPAGYICGRMQYKDRRNQEHPIRYALVKICEADNNDDPLDDPVIQQTHTDHNGNYGAIVLNAGGSGQKIYVKVFTEGVSGAYPGTMSEISHVKDDVFDQTYYLKSPLYSHPQDSSLMVDMTVPNSGGAFMVYDSVIEGFHKARTFFAIELGEIATYWPCSEDQSYYAPSEGIFICQDDRADRDVIMHEYGHYIAQICAFAQGPVGDNPVHFWDLDLRYNPVYRTDGQARNLAFREAWASLFSVATQYGDTWYPNSGDTKYQDLDELTGKIFDIDLEEDTGAHKSPGQFYESMNCCALWDIFDDYSYSQDDDDTLSDPSLSKIWAISRCCRPDDIIDFWNGWFQQFDHEAQMTRIFQAHRMPLAVYVGPPTCFCTDIYVDDDAPRDLGPNDPTVSDPNENGSPDHPFDVIQEAIDVAVDGSTIIVLEGSYYENINLTGKNITLTCRDPNDPNVVANTIIDGKGIGSVFTLINGEDANCVLAGFTVTHGRAEFGGGTYCDGSSPTIVRCTFTMNSASYGGGVANLFGSPTLIGCRFTGNRAELGGAVYNAGRHDTGQTLLTNCAFSGNVAKQAGGAMYDNNANVGLTNCTFAQNSALVGNALALACDSDEQAHLTNIQLSNCILWDGGDEIWNSDGSTVAITYSDVQGGQGSIYDPCEQLVWDSSNINADPCFVSAGYWVDANDPNISGEPNDPDAIWIDGDYHLLVGSPCIDAGDSNAVPPDTTDLDGDGDANEPTPWDIDGVSRFVDDPAILDTGNGAGPIVDMGAYEFAPSVHLAAVKVIARPEPSDCAATTVPEHWATYQERETFYLEVWAQITQPPADSNGLSCMFGDITFDSNIVSAESVEYCANFSAFSSGTVMDGLVDELGGCTLTAGLGIAPEWALVARIQMTALAEGQTDISLSFADTGVSVIGYGLVPSNQISLGSCQVTVGDIPETCLYDLDGDSSIGPGDLALFACCWLHPAADSSCGGRIPCLRCNFDCDGAVGPGDLAWFATGWLKQCGHASIQVPPYRDEQTAESNFSVPSLQSSVSDVEVRPVILTSPSLLDTTETLPTSVSSVSERQDYYVEVWASDIGGTNTGLTSVYVDMHLITSDIVSVQAINHGGIFTMFESGAIQSWGIDELGGSCMVQVGVKPQWVRGAIVKIRAETSGVVSCFLVPSNAGVAALGRGLVARPAIRFGQYECFPSTYSTYSDWLALGKPPCWCQPYQCDGDADGATEGIFKYRVYGEDLALIIENWKKKIDDPTLNPCADIDHKDSGGLNKYRVFTGDLNKVVVNWTKKDTQLSGNCPRSE